jgi:hypothetical protein
MLVSMRTGSQSRRLSVMWVLPLALWAALPAVRWCPPGWKQVCAAALLRCAAMQPPAACDGATEACPLAQAGKSAVPHDACPPGSSCPMADGAQRTAPSDHLPFPTGGAFCVGDPNGGPGLGAPSTQLHPAQNLLAIIPDTGIEPRAATLAEPDPQRASRPPPRPWLRRPPARAPPSLRLT